MNFRGLIVAVVVLAALGGVLYWSQHRKPPAEVPLSRHRRACDLKVDPANVTELMIKQKEPVTLKKTAPVSGRLPNPNHIQPIRRRLPACSRRYRR